MSSAEGSTPEKFIEILQENVAFGLVIGCSLFSILWGLVNTILVIFELLCSLLTIFFQ